MVIKILFVAHAQHTVTGIAEPTPYLMHPHIMCTVNYHDTVFHCHSLSLCVCVCVCVCKFFCHCVCAHAQNLMKHYRAKPPAHLQAIQPSAAYVMV